MSTVTARDGGTIRIAGSVISGIDDQGESHVDFGLC